MLAQLIRGVVCLNKFLLPRIIPSSGVHSPLYRVSKCGNSSGAPRLHGYETGHVEGKPSGAFKMNISGLFQTLFFCRFWVRPAERGRRGEGRRWCGVGEGRKEQRQSSTTSEGRSIVGNYSLHLGQFYFVLCTSSRFFALDSRYEGRISSNMYCLDNAQQQGVSRST